MQSKTGIVLSMGCVVLAAASLRAQPPDPLEPADGNRWQPRLIIPDQMVRFRVTTSGEVLEHSTVQRQVSGGVCPQQVSSHTDADFTGGAFIIQGGFVDTEIAAASYVLTPADFPLRIDAMEMIFATMNATVQTTTQWTVLVWEGTPATGNLVASFSSDDKILPHIVLPPGTNGVNVMVQVDPGDPEQIIVADNGSATFSIGYRIDVHNQPSPSPCFIPPNTCCNAFPTTDVSGVSSLTGNWLDGINCGPLGCPANGGWANFQQLPGSPGSLCTPSGDWVMRATWTPFFCDGGDPGACCLPGGDCLDVVASDCEVLRGAFQGDRSTCSAVPCEQVPAACCFEETAGCLDLSGVNCSGAGGLFQGLGSACGEIECFASGACCMPDGSCLDDVSPDDCGVGEGFYQGNGSVCAQTVCPDPLGGCCFDTGFCLGLTEVQCDTAGASWQGALTNCDDGDDNGTADVCEQSSCPFDLNDDGVVDAADLAQLLGAWGDNPGSPADFNDDGAVNAADLAQLLGAWGPCP